jgi:DNA polymerase/3'-5' exonuclease PolX
MELEIAKQMADSIVEAIQPACERAHVAGSIRRQKPEVKDIEIVAIVKDYDELYQKLSKFGRFIKPGVPGIIDWPPRKNAKYIRMLIDESIKLDMFVASKENFGALYTMRTGSGIGPNKTMGFIPGIFGAWKKKSGGGKMTNCMPTTPDGISIPVPEEEDFFKLCGVEWIPPEMRRSARDVKRIKVQNVSNDTVTV